MELWIIITVAAAFLQNFRSALQKALKGRLSNWGATSSRFFFAAPLAVLLVVVLRYGLDYQLPVPNMEFAGFVILGSIGQITATALLLYLFSFHNFAVGTIFSRTEAAQSALFGILILGDTFSFNVGVAVAISLIGIFLISMPKQNASGFKGFRLFERTTLIGLASGAIFGITAVAYRGASLALPSGTFFVRAAITLAVASVFQSLVMAVYLRLREPGEVSRVFANWRFAGLAGATGMLASFGWFMAMTLQTAVMVKAVAQIEIIFTFIATIFVFKETVKLRETLGILLIVLAILIIVLLQ